MLFHHHGYVSENPRLEPAAGVGINRPEELPEIIDVLIVGAGPAGMITAAQLAQFPSVVTRIIDSRPGRLKLGHADGIQARSVETFAAFGFANEITDEAYRITEMAFWKPDPQKPENIHRTAVTIDDPQGISEFPHLIVNQARVLDYYREFMANSPARNTPDWGWEFLDLTIHTDREYPVEVHLVGTAENNSGIERTVWAKYVLGADGAHSRVRKCIGAQHLGGVSYHAWGVMDVLAVTDFPDIRTKCAIQSKRGSILHIPREGGHLFRMYVDLGEVPEDDAGNVRKTPIEEIIRRANDIITPYTLDVKHVAWWSVYEVGHRVTDRFDDVEVENAGTRTPRVFIAGDACHTHSAKAGQGMNVSMQDGWNLAWKLGHVLSGRAPEALLETYTAERQQIAQDLIDFDRTWSSMMAAKPEELASPTELEEFYVRTAEFPAGFMTQYPPSLIVGSGEHQDLAAGFPIGKRFKSAPVRRVCDGNPIELGHQHKADGRWRIYVFADGAAPTDDSSVVADFSRWMIESENSPLRANREGEDLDAVFDVKVIYQQPHGEVDVTEAPAVFRPQVGPYEVVDLNKVYCADPENNIFDAREISRDGAIVVVRPDQYVAHVLPLNQAGTDELGEFFAPQLTRK